MFPIEILLNSCNQKVSVTPPDKPPPNGFIYITSNPKGFHIYLDNKARRRATPDSLKWLKTGTYLITLKKDLFRDTTFTADIVEGEKRSKFIDLTKDPLMLGSLYCDSRPEGAEIFINDSSTSKLTPDTLKNIIPAYYEVRYHLKNHSDDSVNIPVSSNNLSKTFKILVDTTLWQNYTTNNSPMYTNNLTCVAVDKNNVVWIGTDSDGVFSFDGINWGGKRIFSHLKSKHVNCLTVDNNNTLLIGTEAEFYTYDGVSSNNYKNKTFGVNSFESGTIGITAIGFDNADDWYIGTASGGLSEGYLVPRQNYRSWLSYSFEVIPDTFITSIAYDNLGHVWIGMKSHGVAEYVSNNWIAFEGSGFLINNNVRAIAASPLGEIWIGFGKKLASGSGLANYDNGTWNKVYVLPPSCQTNAIFIDKNNVKWVATDQGLIRFTNSADVTVFDYDNTGLNINDATGVAQDLRGNIWISSYGGGLIEYKGNH